MSKTVKVKHTHWLTGLPETVLLHPVDARNIPDSVIEGDMTLALDADDFEPHGDCSEPVHAAVLVTLSELSDG